MLDSLIERDFGITGSKARRLSLILPVPGGWECTTDNNVYPTQYEAVQVWFEDKKRIKEAAEKEWHEADLRWICNREDTTYTLMERVSGKVLLKTTDRSKIIDYLEDHGNPRCAVRIIPNHFVWEVYNKKPEITFLASEKTDMES